MLLTENYRKIKSKIYISFGILIISSLLIFLSYSFYKYSTNKFQPVYHEKAIDINNQDITERYHSKYAITFVFNNTFLLFFKNLFFMSLLFLSINYSILIKKDEIIIEHGRKINFSYIAMHGIYILIGLTLLFYLSLDLFNPMINAKLDTLQKNTAQAITLLKNANDAYFSKDFKKAEEYYQQYMFIAEKDEIITSRLREIHNILNRLAFNKRQEEKYQKLKSESEKTPDIPRNYAKLAEIFFENKEYETAWYYYQYIAQTESKQRKMALQKIEEIKKIIKYQNSLKHTDYKLSREELLNLLKKQERDNKKIYILRSQAESHLSKEDYHAAFFTYTKILNINPKLRDIELAQRKVRATLKKVAVEIQAINNTAIYPGRNNYIFFLDTNKIITVREMKFISNAYYFKDIAIYEFDEYFYTSKIIRAPYGKSLADKNFTLYCYSITDEQEEYYPNVTVIDGKSRTTTELQSAYIFDLPIDIQTIYDFTYDYENTINYSFSKLHRLYDFAQQLKKTDTFSLGFNEIYIKTVILDKISRIFLFFMVNLMLISMSWRFSANYYKKIPIFHMILMAGIPVFFYFFIITLYSFSTAFYSMLAGFSNFILILSITFTINIVIMIISILFIASTK